MKKILSLLCALVATAAMAQTTGTAKATIDGKEVEIGWVQLWKDGPKFATRNVGATGTSDKESTLGETMTFTDAAKTGSDYVWGANWKTPSKDEMDLLNTSKVTYSYVQQDGVWGFKFTGKGDYTSNSIFLPCYDCDESWCDDYYWTSSEVDDFNVEAWFLDLGYDGEYDCGWYDYYKSDSYKVRPVLVDAPASTPVTLSEDDETYPSAGVWVASKTYDITLNRTMKANQWNTLLLSFPMTAAEVKSNFGSDVTLMKMTGIENNVVNFETVDLTTDANTAVEVCEPYIVKPTAAIEQIKVTDKTGLEQIISKTGYFMALTGGEDYNSNYANREFGKGWTVSASFCASTDDGTYCTTYVLSNDKFYTIDKEVEVKGYRWEIWDENGNNARTLTLSLDGVTTGIENVNADVNANKANGKFIENGRMVIVKDNKKFNVNGQEVK